LSVPVQVIAYSTVSEMTYSVSSSLTCFAEVFCCMMALNFCFCLHWTVSWLVISSCTQPFFVPIRTYWSSGPLWTPGLLM